MKAADPDHRLLAINNYFYRRGGAEAVFLDHIKLFSEIGWETAPFAMQHPDNFASDWSSYFVSEIEYGRQSGLLTKVAQAGKIIYSWEARDRIKALIERFRPNVAHAHNVYHHLSPSIFPVLKAAGIPTVMTAHDLKLACPAYKMLSHNQICERCKGGRIYNVAVHKCIKDSTALSGLVLVETAIHRTLGLYRNTLDRIVVPSRFYISKLIEWGWPEEKLVYIPNFAQTDNLEPFEHEGDYFTYVGRLAPEKGIGTLIRAAAIAGQKLVIAGTGPEEQSLRALAAETGGDITFAGYVSGERLHRLIGEAKALILPSEWYENAPISILEAYALGVPVIGADIGGIPEMIVPGETGMVARTGDAEDLARVMSEAASLPPQARRRMGRLGRTWAGREFSPEAYRNRTLELYAELGAL
ncbi:glycosyltransferase family 4 protein [Ochrobactrum teleogrylli]|uniref:glycosyltransferase family 4 protein n=1 Tax=Ochrobactrum teleogrylli TaxID=2479765 RepID=UPI00384EA5E8